MSSDEELVPQRCDVTALIKATQNATVVFSWR